MNRPHGRDEVRAAVIRAARRRFATEGLTASLRDIAADANVNLGLVHRHFGSKDALILAVFTQAAEAGRERFASAQRFDEGIETLLHSAAGDDAYSRMLALMLLAGADPHDLQHEFPTIARLIELGEGDDARAVVLLAALATLAWPIFRDHLTLAAGYDSADDALAELAELVQRVATKQQSSSA
jgi:AcrR family transcriptional regulator